MASFKCKKNDSFPGLVVRQNWKGILNALGERMGNAHGVGNDAVITQVKEYDAVRIESEFHSTVISYTDRTEKGRHLMTTNGYNVFSDIPYYEIIRNKQIMLGGTLETHTCNSCMGWGKVQCPMCGGRSHNMLNGYLNRCVKCNGTGKVSCEKCAGTGYYQTYKTLTVTDKLDNLMFCPVEALDAMIKKQGIPTDTLYDGSCMKMSSTGQIELNDLEKLYAIIGERLGTDVKDAFYREFEQEYNNLKDIKNQILDDITVHAVCSPILELQYRYRKKEYSLYISKQSPAVYSYSRFPGRLAQRIRNLFSPDKKSDVSGKRTVDRKLGDSYGSKYQK